jgi:hypothetical protein
MDSMLQTGRSYRATAVRHNTRSYGQAAHAAKSSNKRFRQTVELTVLMIGLHITISYTGLKIDPDFSILDAGRVPSALI